MAIYIHSIETMVPESCYSQEDAGRLMASWTRDSKSRRYISKIYQDSGIDVRYSVIPDFEAEQPRAFFRMGEDSYPLEPPTSLRNEIYLNESKRMFPKLAHKLVKGCPDFSANNITHVITVSCTGFYNPGPDIQIIQSLGLPHSTQRYHIGFMGCYGAFPAMRMAKQFCEADADAVVLVVCLEYCSLHLQLDGDLDSIVANSVFADGAAGVLVSAKKPSSGRKAFSLDSFASSLVTEGADDMAWTIGDRGFDIVLSKYVPKILGAKVDSIVTGILESASLQLSDIDYWAVHPGGKTIIDKVQQGLQLSDEQVASSRNVLRHFGNMSSATVLFVMKEILEKAEDDSKVCAMAFGPGLSVETAMVSVDSGNE